LILQKGRESTTGGWKGPACRANETTALGKKKEEEGGVHAICTVVIKEEGGGKPVRGGGVIHLAA